MLDLVVVALATWYVSYAVTSTHGPGGVFEWVREHVWHGRTSKRVDVGERGNRWDPQKNGLLDCPICLAFWVALALLIAPMGVVTQALAMAGLAMILHGWSGWRFAQ